MGQRTTFGDQALRFDAAAAGTVVSGAIGNGGQAVDVIVMAHVTAATGTSPTLVASLEESANGETGWAAVPGSATPSLAGVGSAMANARVSKSYARVTATIGGTGVAVTGRVAVVQFAE